MTTLHRTASKSGKYYTFAIPGVRGQLHIAPKMLQGPCPATIEVVGIEFAEAGAADAEKAALAASKAQAALEKAQARVAKAQAKVAALGTGSATPDAPADATGDATADSVDSDDAEPTDAE